jgi:hypothetical protein
VVGVDVNTADLVSKVARFEFRSDVAGSIITEAMLVNMASRSKSSFASSLSQEEINKIHPNMGKKYFLESIN